MTQKNNDFRQRILEISNTSVDAILERPGMYGSKQEAIETQLCTHLQYWFTAKHPDVSEEDLAVSFRGIYSGVLHGRFDSSTYPASGYSLSMSDFLDVLRQVASAVRAYEFPVEDGEDEEA